MLLSGVVGVATGLGVAGYERVTVEALLDRVLVAPLWVQAVAPVVGLVVATLALRYLAARAAPSTADAYVENFHDLTRPLPLAPVPGRLAASIATIGFGGALGLEGGSIYLGAAVGTLARRARWVRERLGVRDTKVLMVAGAAAGVAAIFKAPATGAVFALEVPFRDDVGRRLLLPSLVGAAGGYLAFVAVNGTTPLLEVQGNPPFDLRDLGGAVLLGVACGAAARAFALILQRAKTIAGTVRLRYRLAVGGALLAALVLAGHVLFDAPLTLGPGYAAVGWAAEPERALPLIGALLVLRCVASAVTLGAGGSGGLFIPLVVAGALVGRLVGGAIEALDTSLFTVVGIAAFLGAGYRVPLAAVTFVAEATGRPGYVVPGLLAAVAADLMMGDASVSAYQVQTPGR